VGQKLDYIGELINRVPACLAGVKAGRVHLRWVAGDTGDLIRQVTLRSSATDYKLLAFSRAVGTGPANPAAAGPII